MKTSLLILLLLVTPVHASVDFDGVDDVIKTDADAVNLNTGTISMWINTDFAWDQSSDDYYLMDIDTSRYLIFFAANSNEVTLAFNGRANNFSGSALNLPANTWHHIAVAYEKSSDTIKLYVDGEESALGTKSGTWGSSSHGTNLHIGRRFADVAGDFRGFDGEVDDINTWSVVLTDAQILNLYASKMRRMGCQSESVLNNFPLDECSDGANCDGIVFNFICGSGEDNGTGDDGPNNTGMTGAAGKVLSYL